MLNMVLNQIGYSRLHNKQNLNPIPKPESTAVIPRKEVFWTQSISDRQLSKPVLNLTLEMLDVTYNQGQCPHYS